MKCVHVVPLNKYEFRINSCWGSHVLLKSVTKCYAVSYAIYCFSGKKKFEAEYKHEYLLTDCDIPNNRHNKRHFFKINGHK